MRFELKDPLSEAQWNSVEKAALEILKNTGLDVQHGEILSILASKKGVKVDGARVKLDPNLVLKMAATVKGTSGYDTPLITGAYSHNFLVPGSDQARKPTLSDLILTCKQADAIGSGVCAPVVPLDVEGPVQEIVMERVTHENCRFSYGGGQCTTVAAAEAGIEMSQVVKRPHELEIWVTSPLVLDPGGLEIMWKIRSRKPHIRISNMPVRGMSAPITLAGIMAQTVAEVLGAATVLRLLDITDSLAYRVDAFWMYSMDMRTANVLFAGPTYLRMMILSTFLGKRYGTEKPMGKAILTSSQLPDAQAGAEKCSQGLVAAIAGVGTFTAGGALGGVEVYSPLQMILDNEILRWIQSFIKPLDFSEKEFLLDVVAEVGPAGTFLAHDSTVEKFREVFWKPQLFSEIPFPSWLNEGKVKLLDKARGMLDSLKLAEGPVISKEQKRELDKIEKKFAAKL